MNNMHKDRHRHADLRQSHDTYPAAWISGTRRWMDLLKPYLDKSSNVYHVLPTPNPIPCTWDPTITLDYGINCFCFAGDGPMLLVYRLELRRAAPEQRYFVRRLHAGAVLLRRRNVFTNPVYYVDYRHAGGTFNVAYCDGRVENRSDTAGWDSDARSELVTKIPVCANTFNGSSDDDATCQAPLDRRGGHGDGVDGDGFTAGEGPAIVGPAPEYKRSPAARSPMGPCTNKR